VLDRSGNLQVFCEVV